MRKHDLQNEQLDRIGRRLLQTAKLNGEEIERIVASPRLFESVKAAIEAEEQLRRKPKRFENWLRVSFSHRQTAGALTILLVSLTCAAVIIFKRQESSQLVEQPNKAEIERQITRVGKPSELLEIKRTEITAVKNRAAAAAVEPAAFKVKKTKTPTRATKANTVKPLQKSSQQTPEVFYSLALAGTWEADGEDLRVVRAEISRAELFALGVDLPVENETAKIKTDLLVGADGVARAIRFVE